MELLTAGQLLTRLAGNFPDKVRAAHEKTVRYSPKPEADVLTILERTAGKYAADAIREVAMDSKPPASRTIKPSAPATPTPGPSVGWPTDVSLPSRAGACQGCVPPRYG
jgi:hypothetical protein